MPEPEGSAGIKSDAFETARSVRMIFVVPLNLLLCHVRGRERARILLPIARDERKQGAAGAGAAGSRFPEWLVSL